MANTLLTPTMITRESLRILHQKLNFIGNIHRGYDDRYAKRGAKIGNDLAIRLPNEFTVRDGATLDLQDVSESSVTLTVDSQKGVDISFTSEERTMHIDDFSDRYLKPAMSVLAAKIEADALSMYKDVYQFTDGEGAAHTLGNVLAANAALTNALAPYEDRCQLMGPQGHVDLVTDTKNAVQRQRRSVRSVPAGPCRWSRGRLPVVLREHPGSDPYHGYERRG